MSAAPRPDWPRGVEDTPPPPPAWDPDADLPPQVTTTPAPTSATLDVGHVPEHRHSSCCDGCSCDIGDFLSSCIDTVTEGPVLLCRAYLALILCLTILYDEEKQFSD